MGWGGTAGGGVLGRKVVAPTQDLLQENFWGGAGTRDKVAAGLRVCVADALGGVCVCWCVCVAVCV